MIIDIIKYMPAEVKILIEGQTNADSVAEDGAEKDQPTITLVRDGDLKMVVDPGLLESQQVLIDALAKENISIDDVSVICITHSHIDHYRNVGMFPNAKVLEYYGLWDKTGVETYSENFTPHIRILHTPGHDRTGLTLMVTTKDGVVAICGDVFWKEDYPPDPRDDAYASDPVRLEESREMVKKWLTGLYLDTAGCTKIKNFLVQRTEQGVQKLKLKRQKQLQSAIIAIVR